MRHVWDPKSKYSDYSFLRQPQTFPDVLLARDDDIIFGIELKSWYVLSKEGEPSFRFKVNRDVCTDKDFIMIVSWCLSNIMSGTPIIFRPFVEMARYFCEYRNYWWQNIRRTDDSSDIDEPNNVSPYPNARDNISDEPKSVKDNNFGRIARMGLLDQYKLEMNDISLLGIRASEWRKFFRQQKL